MKLTAQTFAITSAIAIFVGLPLLPYSLGDAPRRAYLKEGISLLTLLAFTMILGQFFLARSNETLLSLFTHRKSRKFTKSSPILQLA